MKKVTRTRLEVLREVFAKYEYENKPYLSQKSSYSAEDYYKLQLEVRWCSKGGTEPVAAYFFGKFMQTMAGIAQFINTKDLQIEEETDVEDPMIKTKDDWNKWVELFIDVINHNENGENVAELYIIPFLTEDDCSAEFEDCFVD